MVYKNENVNMLNIYMYVYIKKNLYFISLAVIIIFNC